MQHTTSKVIGLGALAALAVGVSGRLFRDDGHMNNDIDPWVSSNSPALIDTGHGKASFHNGSVTISGRSFGGPSGAYEGIYSAETFAKSMWKFRNNTE